MPCGPMWVTKGKKWTLRRTLSWQLLAGNCHRNRHTIPEYTGRGRPPTRKQSQPEWKCLQVTKHRSGGRLIGITHRVFYGDPKEVPDLMGLNTAYVERTNLTSRQMNGRMVRKTLSFSKKEKMLEASCA